MLNEQELMVENERLKTCLASACEVVCCWRNVADGDVTGAECQDDGELTGWLVVKLYQWMARGFQNEEVLR